MGHNRSHRWALMFGLWLQTYTARYMRWIDNESGWWATISGPSWAQQGYLGYLKRKQQAWTSLTQSLVESGQQRIVKSFEQKKKIV